MSTIVSVSTTHRLSRSLFAYSLLIPLNFHILSFENKSRSNRFFHPSEILSHVFVSAQSAAHSLAQYSTVRYASHEQVNVAKRIYYIIIVMLHRAGYIFYSFASYRCTVLQKAVKINNNLLLHTVYLCNMYMYA